MRGPPTRSVRQIELDAELRELIVVTDSNSLYDVVHHDKSASSDKRFRIVVAMLREEFNRVVSGGLRRTLPGWANTNCMLADGLTKMAVGAAATGAIAILALMRAKSFQITPGRIGRIAALAAAAQAKVAGAVDNRHRGLVEPGFSFELTVPLGPLALVIEDPSWFYFVLALLVLIVSTILWSRIRSVTIWLGRSFVIRLASSLGGVATFEPRDINDDRRRIDNDDDGDIFRRGDGNDIVGGRHPPPTTRTVATQAQTTYTSLRGVLHPRFQPLAERDSGVFVDGLPSPMFVHLATREEPAGPAWAAPPAPVLEPAPLIAPVLEHDRAVGRAEPIAPV